MKLYVSGPMTGIPEYNFPAFNAAAAKLEAAGYDVENPATKGIIDGWKWADYLKHDVRVVTQCDGLALLPGWELSEGANLEVYVATALGLDVFLLGVWLARA